MTSSCGQVKKERERPLAFFLIKTLILSDHAPHPPPLGSQLTLVTSLEAASPNTATLGLGVNMWLSRETDIQKVGIEAVQLRVMGINRLTSFHQSFASKKNEGCVAWRHEGMSISLILTQVEMKGVWFACFSCTHSHLLRSVRFLSYRPFAVSARGTF